MAEMASIGEAGYFPSDPSNTIFLATELVSVAPCCWILDANFQEFYGRLERETAEPLYWVVKSASKGLSDEHCIFATVYEFLDLDTANI